MSLQEVTSPSNRTLTEAEVGALRPAIHSHVTLLTAAGVTPTEALAIAAESAALCHSEFCDEALRRAYEALATSPVGIRIDHESASKQKASPKEGSALGKEGPK